MKDCFDREDHHRERLVLKIVIDSNGHFAGHHELLLYGVELESRKADCGEDPLGVAVVATRIHIQGARF